MPDPAMLLPPPVATPLRDLDPSKCVSLDYETFSEVDLRKSGASRYARDPSTEILMLAWSFHDSDEVQQWVPATGESRPRDLVEILSDPRMTFFAWNAPFEMAITQHVLGLDVRIPQWRDVMVLAHTLSFPGKLEKVGEIIGLSPDKAKMSKGQALIRKFCKPRKPTKNLPHTRSDAATDPDDWVEFLTYNRRDVVAEKEILSVLRKYDMPAREWDLWHIDQKINTAGIPINLNLVRKAQFLAEATIETDLAKMKRVTGLQNPNSNAQLLPWLRSRGYPYEDMKKAHVEKAYADFLEWTRAEDRDPFKYDDTLGEALRLRLRVSKSSVKKFPALLAATDPEGDGSSGRLRYAHQFAGAGRTWRWSGRKFQPQNLPRPEKYLEDIIPDCASHVEHCDPGAINLLYDNPMDVLTGVVRPCVQPPHGNLLVDADLSAIENVVLGWLAREQKILQVFLDDKDPYVDFATDMFGLSYGHIERVVKSGDKSMRTTAKPGVLGCGYMLGPGEARVNPRTGETEATGLLGYAWNMGVKTFTQELSKLSVETFRGKFSKVVDFWWDMDRAARRTINTGQPQTVGYLVFDMKGPFMRIRLPSGRYLHYARPKLLNRKTPWGEVRKQVTYENLDNSQWRRVTTHPGKLAENVTQAVARDILAHGMFLADRNGLDIRLHVHDQIVAVSPENRANEDLDLLVECMTTLPPWANNKLPLKAAGQVTNMFLKD